MPSPVGKTYSFKDLVGVMTSPLLILPLQLVGGNIGLGTITINPLTVRTDHLVGTDGTVMPTYAAGDNADVTIEVQQTSPLHHALLDVYNAAITAANGGDVSNWATFVMSFRTILDGSGHYLAGVSFDKTPPKPYAVKGQNITWKFWAAYAVNQ
jgi:hypothetical protein